MGWNINQITDDKLRRRIKEADEQQNSKAMAPRIPEPEPEPDAGPALVKTQRAKKRSVQRYSVRITRFGRRCLDVDNFNGGCKAVIDQLRYHGYIKNDDPGSIEISFQQFKSVVIEGLLIEIKPIP